MTSACLPQVGAMTCSACSAAVEKALRGRNGVTRAHVALTTQEARVEYQPMLVTKVRLSLNECIFKCMMLPAAVDASA